jgi:hypothetical protein
MFGRGQGAMEYLMSYGWAILVVMVVGAALWQLGIFNMGGSVPPTSSGFSTVKPILGNCKLQNGVFPDNQVENGFNCEFINTVDKIYIQFIVLKINGGYCGWNGAIMSKNPDLWMPPWFSELYVRCIAGNCVYFTCSNSGNPNPACNSAGELMVEKDRIVSFQAWDAGAGTSPCQNIKRGVKSEVFIDVIYRADFGGVSSIKHDTGTIRIIPDK